MTDRLVMLLVDDDEVFLALAEAYFTQAGFQVVCATNSLDALDLVEKLTTGLDCVVSDIWLPKGTPHGISLASMVGMRYPGAVKILITGDQDAKQYVTPSDGAVFIKPANFPAIVAKIHDLIRRANERQ